VKEEASVGFLHSSPLLLCVDLLFSDIAVAPQQHRLDLLAVEWSMSHCRLQAPPDVPPSTTHRPQHLHGRRYPNPTRAQEDLCPPGQTVPNCLLHAQGAAPRFAAGGGGAVPMARPQHCRGRFRARPSPPRRGRCSSIRWPRSLIHRPRTQSAVHGAPSTGSRAGGGCRRGMRRPWPDRSTTGAASAPGRSSVSATSELRGSFAVWPRANRSWHSPVPIGPRAWVATAARMVGRRRGAREK
jgi:hypothetical protein